MKSFSSDVSAAHLENFCSACGLFVLTFPGSPTAERRFVFLAKMLSDLTLYIGYIMVGFDPQRRALHDYVADTRVIKRDQARSYSQTLARRPREAKETPLTSII